MTDLTQVSQHTKIIAAAGGPEWYDWCDLDEELITGHCDPDFGEDTVCPPACEAAVVMYCGDVRAWLQEYPRSIVVDIQIVEGGELWRWYCDGKVGKERGQLAASVALIAAVAEQIGGSDE